MQDVKAVPDLLSEVRRWAGTEAGVRALALVGSYARGNATEDSDVDLVVLVDQPDRWLTSHQWLWLTSHQWLGRFGSVERVTHEDWGLVQSLRVRYRHGLEVEFGLTTLAWTGPPLDAGTARVIRDGMKVLSDPEGLLAHASRLAALGDRAVARRSAKVVLVDADGRVLLFCGHDPHGPPADRFWFPPGGAVEADGTVQDAARREVAEEVGVDLSDAGDQERRAISTYRWWELDEIASTDETIYPEGLADLLRDKL